MVTFATLSLVNVRKDRNFSKSIQEHNDKYYDAYNIANEQIATLIQTFETARQNETFDQLESSYTFQIPVDDTHELSVAVEPVNSDLLYKLTQFEMNTTKEWSGDDSLPLLQKGE